MERKTISKDDVLELAKENKVRSIRLMFMDLTGVNKNVEIPVQDLKAALDGSIMFDGSSIEGFARIEESDMFLRPDPSTFVVFPWIKGENKVARLICDIYNPDGSNFSGCSRGVLRRMIKEAKDMGYTMAVGPEAEFFLFLLDENGVATTKTHDQGGYFDLSPIDRGEDARKDVVEYLEQMGFRVEASHHEVAPGQHEIDFSYSDVLTTADNLATFRMVVRTVALSHSLHATFMPKPIYGICGSGMHTNQSLFTNESNAFYDPDGKYQLSDVCLHYIGGLLKYAPEFTAITNPIVNSYKRLVPDYEAPVYVAWSHRNRSPLVRVPAIREKATRVELRSPDPSCNPYLAFAVMLKAGLEGIKQKIDPGKPVDKNIFAMDPEERKKHNIGLLPRNLLDAIENLEKSNLMKEALGEHVFNQFVHVKKMEWNLYNEKVHNWEIERYLALY
ncbi:MAG: type I glutamate--ammonia ligase [Candidatus Eremiobacteraeota bacterium]|nr:type I glutamate--ammonia ligase [Candidatus Eremiobacteraeota bacterium]